MSILTRLCRYAYAYTARIFNGEFHEAGIEAVDLILNLSSVLSENKIYQNGTEALHKSLENSLKVPNSPTYMIFTNLAYSLMSKTLVGFRSLCSKM